MTSLNARNSNESYSREEANCAGTARRNREAIRNIPRQVSIYPFGRKTAIDPMADYMMNDSSN
jgi:hypothetical protein